MDWENGIPCHIQMWALNFSFAKGRGKSLLMFFFLIFLISCIGFYIMPDKLNDMWQCCYWTSKQIKIQIFSNGLKKNEKTIKFQTIVYDTICNVTSGWIVASAMHNINLTKHCIQILNIKCWLHNLAQFRIRIRG